MIHEWQAVNEDTDRMAVTGGWLYRTRLRFEGAGLDDEHTLAMAFVPDPDHANVLPEPEPALAAAGADDDDRPFTIPILRENRQIAER